MAGANGVSRATDGQVAIRVFDDCDTIAEFDNIETVKHEFLGETFGMSQEYTTNDSLRGTRARSACRIRIAKEDAAGTLTSEPTPLELSQLLEVAMGGTDRVALAAYATGTTYNLDLTESLKCFGVLCDKAAQVYAYPNMVANKLTISGSSGQPIKTVLEAVGTSEVALGIGTFPTATIPAIDCATPYLMSDMTYSLAADVSAVTARSFEITIENFVDTNRYLNSITRSGLDALDRKISLKMEIPWNADSLALHDQAVAGDTGTLTLTNGAQVTVFTFGNLKFPAKTPTQTRRGDETFLQLEGMAYEVTAPATPELAVVHTP